MQVENDFIFLKKVFEMIVFLFPSYVEFKRIKFTNLI